MRRSARLITLVVSVLVLATPASSQDAGSGCITIDFESVPGEVVAEGLVINTQYLDSLGVFFELGTAPASFPRIAEVGEPTTAFEGFGGGDMPAPDQNIGTYFLTDDGELAGLVSPPLVVSFAAPVDSVSGVVLDIDFDEYFVIEARGANNEVLVADTISAGDPGTGEGIASVWGFRRESADVHWVYFLGGRDASGAFGLGFDNFTTCVPGRATAVERSGRTRQFVLQQNHPNPFKSTTAIQYELQDGAHVQIEVFSLLGQRVALLVDEMQPHGSHEVIWEAEGLTSGTYMYRLQAGNTVAVRFLTLLK